MKNRPSSVPYELRVYEFLAVLRFFAFAAAVGIILLMPPEPLEGSYFYLVTGMVGVYTLVRLVYRLPIWYSGLVGEVILWGELVAIIAVVLFTGGLNSGFLLYSLVPVATVAMHSDQRKALAFALLSAFSLIIAHVGLSLFTPAFAWVLSGRYLSLLALYVAICMLLAIVPHRANLNLRRRLSEEAMGAERNRLRRQLHDNLAQSLAFLQMKTRQMLDSAPRADEILVGGLKEIEGSVESCYQDVRDTLVLLGGPPEGFSLSSNLSSYLQEWSQRSGIQAHYVPPANPLRLSPATQWELMHIVREALANIQRHSGAHQSWVEVKGDAKEVSLAVRDDGKGFSSSQRLGLGLGIMEEGAKDMGGKLTINSTPGGGTEITLIVPQGK